MTTVNESEPPPEYIDDGAFPLESLLGDGKWYAANLYLNRDGSRGEVMIAIYARETFADKANDLAKQIGELIQKMEAQG